MKGTVSPELREGVLDAIAAGTGLHFPLDRWPEVERGLQAAGEELHAGNAEFLLGKMLGVAPDPHCTEVVAKHLTVGETYFFRDPATFEVLRHEILTPLIHERRAAGRRHLRLWSDGCCTGEEPYTLAIIVSQLLPDLADWNVSILASDINRDFLRTAEAGIYKKWSFRGTSEEFQLRHFTGMPEERHAILPRYRKMVRFRFLNLAGESYPSSATGTDGMDVIVCKNVLIYFTPEQCQRVSGRLRASLAEEGWLITSAAEGATFAPLVPVAFPGVIVYRKTTPLPLLPAPEGSEPSLDWEHLAPLPPLPKKVEPAAPEEPSLEELAQHSRAQANAGELKEALRLCDLALRRNRLNARLHYLRGSILQEGEQIEEAAKAFRRAVYLDHHFVLAFFALGTLAGKKGRRAEQIRHFEQALHLLRALPPQQVVPESAGITARRLAEVIVTGMHSTP